MLIQAWEQRNSQGNWTEWVLLAILRKVHKCSSGNFRTYLKISYHSGCNMSYNPNSWSKCEVPTALALKSCSASRMVPVSANLDIRNDPGKVVKWWSLFSEARRGRNEAVRLLLHCLRLLSPVHYVKTCSQEASSEKFHWSNTHSPMCAELQLKVCMHLRLERWKYCSTKEWNTSTSLSGHRDFIVSGGSSDDEVGS